MLRALALLSIVVAAIAACGEDAKVCYPGEYIGCPCPNGGWGYGACSAAGDFSTSQCVCDGTTPGLDAGIHDAAGGG